MTLSAGSPSILLDLQPLPASLLVVTDLDGGVVLFDNNDKSALVDGGFVLDGLVPGAHELEPGDEVGLGRARLSATQADHDARRMPWSPADGLGFVLDRVYFAGDTDLFDGMAEIGERGLDVALLPIWGWGPRLPPGHLDPERAAEATRLLSPRVVIPIHWGTYLRAAMRRGDLEAPAREFAAAVARTAPASEVVVLRPGEAFRESPTRDDAAAGPGT